MDEQQQAARIRGLVRGLTVRGRGRRYPAELQRQVVAYVRQRRERGATLKSAAREVEVSWRTVEHWCNRKRPTPPPKKAALLTPVVLRATPEPTAKVVVHGPHGLRIEGLNVSQIVELLARLG
jgi:transposase-like protein